MHERCRGQGGARSRFEPQLDLELLELQCGSACVPTVSRVKGQPYMCGSACVPTVKRVKGQHYMPNKHYPGWI